MTPRRRPARPNPDAQTPAPKPAGEVPRLTFSGDGTDQQGPAPSGRPGGAGRKGPPRQKTQPPAPEAPPKTPPMKHARPALLRHRAHSHYAVWRPIGKLEQRGLDVRLILRPDQWIPVIPHPEVTLPDLPARVETSLRPITDDAGLVRWLLVHAEPTALRSRRAVYLCGTVQDVTDETITIALTNTKGQYPQTVTVRAGGRELHRLGRRSQGRTVLIHAHPAKLGGTGPHILEAHHVILVPPAPARDAAPPPVQPDPVPQAEPSAGERSHHRARRGRNRK